MKNNISEIAVTTRIDRWKKWNNTMKRKNTSEAVETFRRAIVKFLDLQMLIVLFLKVCAKNEWYRNDEHLET